MKATREQFQVGVPAGGDVPISAEAEDGNIPIDNEFQWPWVAKEELAAREANAALAELARQGKITLDHEGVDMEKVALGAGVLVTVAAVAVAYKKGMFDSLLG